MARWLDLAGSPVGFCRLKTLRCPMYACFMLGTAILNALVRCKYLTVANEVGVSAASPFTSTTSAKNPITLLYPARNPARNLAVGGCTRPKSSTSSELRELAHFLSYTASVMMLSPSHQVEQSPLKRTRTACQTCFARSVGSRHSHQETLISRRS